MFYSLSNKPNGQNKLNTCCSLEQSSSYLSIKNERKCTSLVVAGNAGLSTKIAITIVLK